MITEPSNSICNPLARVVASLRHELHQYGEMLALLEQQRKAVMIRAAGEVMKSVVAIHQQMAAIQSSRKERDRNRAEVAQRLGQPAGAPFSVLVPLLPARFALAVEALVSENSQLEEKFQRRARQNHLLLGQLVELMQQFMNALAPPDPAGAQPAPGLPSVSADHHWHGVC